MFPRPVFPIALDSDYTLFHVYNNTQSVLSKSIDEEDDVIEIIPKSANDADVWPDSGFATIEKELIYFDQVEKNRNGKVVKLKKCIRGLEGKTQNYSKSTSIYGNVVAQTHNQLADAIIQIEETIGALDDIVKSKMAMASTETKSEELGFSASLHSSLGSMLGCAPVGDDACPDVEFEFNCIDNGEKGEFCLRIFGSFNSFKIDFGDGKSTTTEFSGTHTFANNDCGSNPPTATVVADNCCIIQQATTVSEACDAPVIVTPAVPFNITIPDVPDFPEFVAPKQVCPGQLFNLPPIVIPELNLCSLIPTISVIVSNTNICPTPSIVLDISSIAVEVDCPSPSIFLECPTPSIVVLLDISNIAVDVDCPAPSIFVDCPTPSIFLDCTPSLFVDIPSIILDIPDININVPSQIEVIGCDIPSIVSVIGCCDFPSSIPITGCCNFPSEIQVVCPSLTICPSVTQSPTPFAATNPFPYQHGSGFFSRPMNATPIVTEEVPVNIDDIGIPDEIKVTFPEIPDLMVKHDIPKEITLKPSEEGIKLDASGLPTKIVVEMAPDFPKELPVTGIPKAIEVTGFPKGIPLIMPENPIVEMKYMGAPIDVHVHVDVNRIISDVVVT